MGVSGVAVVGADVSTSVWRFSRPGAGSTHRPWPDRDHHRTAAARLVCAPGVEQPAIAAADHPEPVGGATRSEAGVRRSEEHTSELQSLMRISYAVFCLKQKNTHNIPN